MNKNKILILLSSLVVLAIIVWIILFVVNKTAYKNPPVTSQQPVVQGQPVDVLAQGKIPPNLPDGVFADQSSQVITAYVIPYGQNEQSTVIYTSTSSISQIYSYYLGYLNSKDYQILNHFLKGDTGTLYATSAGGDISVNLSVVSGKTQVTLNYLKK